MSYYSLRLNVFKYEDKFSAGISGGRGAFVVN